MNRELSSVYPLKKNRMHEVCGAGAGMFAAALAAQSSGSFLWVKESHHSEQLNPAGLIEFVAPDRLLVATTNDQVESLAVAEEALRSSVLPLVVMSLSSQIDLTAGRRLQLAAQAGKSMALALIPEGMGSNAAETRWRCNPLFDPTDSTLQHWEIIKNKTGTLGVWHVRWSKQTRRINVVSEARL